MQPPPIPPQLPSNQPPESGWKKLLGPLAGIGILLAKFAGSLKFILAPLLKFFPVILKTGGSMIFTIAAYAMFYGWKWAFGFVLLIFVHEAGHLVAARHFGVNAGAPVFIPFMGAFIALRDAPKNAWIEAWIGIMGPIFGAVGGLICHSAGEIFHIDLLIAIAWTTYWLNLFNLIPLGQLDGGHVATALSPWMWVPGFAVMGYMAFTRPNIIIFLVLLAGIPRIISLFRQRTAEEERFYEITPMQRLQVGSMYFALIGSLVFLMHAAHVELNHIHGQHSTSSSPQVQSWW